MRVLLIYPSIDCPAGTNHGITSISAVLRTGGHETRLIHVCEKLWPIPSEDEIVARVRGIDPGLIGFSIMSQQYAWCRGIAARLRREFPEVPLVAGGVHCTMVPEDVTADGDFDYVCVGEGEYALLELVNRIERGEDTTTTPNFWLPAGRGGRRNPVAPFPDLAEFPPQDYDIFDIDHIVRARDGWMGLLTSRGCPYKCTYCFNKEIVDRYIEDGAATRAKEYLRHYPVDRMIGEIRDLTQRHPGIRTLIFDDDLFTINRHYVSEFTAAYRRAGIGLPYVVNAHVQQFNDAMARDLAESGCRIVKYGLESGSDRIRREVLWRFMTNDAIERAFEAAHRHDLHTSAFVMFGLPGETRADIEETIRLCARIRMGRFRWAIFFPFPGTAGYRIAKEAGLIDFDRARALGNYFDGSCLRFGDAQDLLIEKLGRLFHWWVNAGTGWPSAPLYERLVRDVEAMDRSTWDREKEGLSAHDRELSEELLGKGIPHYSIRYSHVMAVNSDFILREREERRAGGTGARMAYTLD